MNQNIVEFEAQPALQPGEAGWWQVWGARPQHIRAGDIVMVKNNDDEIETLYVEDTYRAKSAPMRVGIVLDGEQSTLGALCPIVLLRKGTHHILAD